MIGDPLPKNDPRSDSVPERPLTEPLTKPQYCSECGNQAEGDLCETCQTKLDDFELELLDIQEEMDRRDADPWSALQRLIEREITDMRRPENDPFLGSHLP